MFTLSKKTEYGLMALAYLSDLPESHWANVSEIASASSIPRELLAKILSALVKAGLATSCSGPTGGFRLGRPASSMSLAEILGALDKRPGLINCITENGNCERTEICSIRLPMARIHRKVTRVLEETMLTEIIVRPDRPAPVEIKDLT